jgi:hypothetical protein
VGRRNLRGYITGYQLAILLIPWRSIGGFEFQGEKIRSKARYVGVSSTSN